MSTQAYLSAGALAILLVFLPKHEGEVRPAYKDPVGIWTICVGSTTDVKPGHVASKKECEDRLRKDIDSAARIYQANVPKEVRDTMDPKSEAMFISFIFHYGPGGKGVKDGFVYLKSGAHSTMHRKLQAGDVEGACREFPKWNKNNLRGIERRNNESMAICLDGVSSMKQRP